VAHPHPMNVIKIMGRNGIDANMPGDRMTLPCTYWQGNQGITVLSFFPDASLQKVDTDAFLEA